MGVLARRASQLEENSKENQELESPGREGVEGLCQIVPELLTGQAGNGEKDRHSGVHQKKEKSRKIDGPKFTGGGSGGSIRSGRCRTDYQKSDACNRGDDRKQTASSESDPILI